MQEKPRRFRRQLQPAVPRTQLQRGDLRRLAQLVHPENGQPRQPTQQIRQLERGLARRHSRRNDECTMFVHDLVAQGKECLLPFACACNFCYVVEADQLSAGQPVKPWEILSCCR